MKEATSTASTSANAELASKNEEQTTSKTSSSSSTSTPISNDYDDDDGDLLLDDDVEIAPPPELPTVTPGSQSWHREFPNEWLSIIARDIRHQEQVNIL